VAALAIAGVAVARGATAQAYLRFAVPDSALAGAIRGSGGQFEAGWNELLAALLRAGRPGAGVPRDSAARLQALATRVAAAEPAALGSRIGSDALARLRRWTSAGRAHRLRAAVSESLAVSAQGGRRFAAAESLFRAALADYRRIGETRREAWVLGSLAQVAFLSGDLARADSVYREALVARRAIGDPRMIGNTLNSLGSTSLLLGHDAEALGWLQQARVVREGTGERGPLGATLASLGIVAARLGQSDSAIVFCRQALDLTVAAGDSARTGEVLVNLGQLHADRGERQKALGLFERALTLLRERGDARTEATLLVSLANVLSNEGRFAEAAARAEESLSRARDAGDSRLVLGALIYASRIAVQVQDPRAGRPFAERAVALADSLGDHGLHSGALANLSEFARLEGDARGAERMAERALALATASGDSAHVNDVAQELGWLAVQRGDGEGERRWYERAEGSGRALGIEVRLSNLNNLAAACVHRGELDEAERRYTATLDLAQAADIPDGVWPAMLGVGDVAEKRGEFPRALSWYRRAATLIDTVRTRAGSEAGSVSLLARRRWAFEALVHLLVKLDPAHPDSGWAAEAFQWSERARARAFLDLVRAAGGRSEPVRPLTLDEARARLGAAEALLEYSVGDSSTALWVVTRRAVKLVMLPARPAVRARVEVLRRSLSDPATAETPRARAAARALDSLLVERALPLLKGITHLVIAPDDALALVPFEALLTRPVPGPGPAPPASYLVERFAISYSPSATALATLRRADDAPGGIVALGDPRFAADSGAASGERRGPALPPLPNTAAEVAALRSLAGPRPFTALTGADATRERLLGEPALGRAGLLHMATHGEANESEPSRSGLWLAVSDGRPGFLSVADILALRLHAELVTLSACETGLGRLERGEGVMGLTRAFLVAGARSVVVSLWKVNDRSSSQLMQRFYEGLLARGEPREQALALAKRALLRNPETRSPFHWAPFVLVGEGGRVR
jgi:CHAT domain-containing protein